MPNLMVVHNDYPDERSLQKVLNYALNTSFYGGYAVDPEAAFEQMMFVKRNAYKVSGVQLKHFILSFSDQEMLYLNFEDLLHLGFQIGNFLKEYQLVYGIHTNTEHIHMHFVMNTVSFLDGHKYADGLYTFRKMCSFLAAYYPRFSVQLYPSGYLS